MSENEIEPQEPEATRKKWSRNKRVGVGLLVLLALLVVGWALLNIYANSLLQRELDAIAARGEPIRWEDMAGPPDPDEQNSALLYKQASERFDAELNPWLGDVAERLNEQGDGGDFYAITPLYDDELRKKYPKEVKELLEQNELGLAYDAISAHEPTGACFGFLHEAKGLMEKGWE